MASQEIDAYLSKLDPMSRGCLEQLRGMIHEFIPGIEECISYQVPAFRIEGGVVAGFASFKNHLSYLPFSGSVLNVLELELGKRTWTKSSLHFTSMDPLSDELVSRLLEVRLAEIRNRGH